jgi:hypothetical protein
VVPRTYGLVNVGGRTVGVEEFVLVDAAIRRTAPCAADSFVRAHRMASIGRRRPHAGAS